MTIEELEDKHRIVSWHNVSTDNNLHTKLSIQFAIEVLENMEEHTQINDKIQELKQYYDSQI